MTTGELVEELWHQGIQLLCDGNQLRVRAPKGAITPEIKTRLKAEKLQILDTLRETRIYGIPISELQELAGDDWPELQNDPGQLEAFAHAIQTRRMRESGKRPDHYTKISICQHCGPVWLWEGAPRHVEACPWCFNRLTGASIPWPGKRISSVE